MNGDASHVAEPSATNSKQNEGTVDNVRPKIEKQPSAPQLANGYLQAEHTSYGYVNGAISNGSDAETGQKPALRLDEIPLEIRQQFEGAFLPLSKLIERTARECWRGLSLMVDQLASNSIQSAQNATKQLPNGIPINDQSKANLDKKDQLLNFASERKADFIKLLVLLQWSQSADDLNTTLQLNLWLHSQRLLYSEATFETGLMKRRLAHIQVPNPDLRTAAEVLSLRSAREFPKLGYVPEQPLSAKGILKTLKELNGILCSRLLLDGDLPIQMQNFRIHDGRVTFHVLQEFELDLSVMDDDPSSQFYFLDFRFAFSPSSDIPSGPLHHDISFKANEMLRGSGILALYEFLHDLTLSYKLNILHKQALELLQGQWSSDLRVELIRRTLVLHYWTKQPYSKSWLEIGIKSGRESKGDTPTTSDPYLAVKWMKEQREVGNVQVNLDSSHLTIETVLRQVLAQHVSDIFDLIFDGLSANSLYANGELLVEQTYSATDPNDCSLDLQLSKKRSLSIKIEPVAGTVVLSPSNLASARLEHELLQSKNLSVDLPSRLFYLRCVLVEQDLASCAESVNWTVSPVFQPGPISQKGLFSSRGTPLRSLFLRQTHWKPEHLLAATYSKQGDHWWLVQQATGQQNTESWTTQQIETSTQHFGNQLSPSYLTALAAYTSGILTLQANAAYLSTASVKFVLPAMPRFDKGYNLPKLCFEFLPVDLRKNWDLDQEPQETGSQINLESNKDAASTIQQTITITYSGFDQESQKAVLHAEGHVSTPRKVWSHLAKASLDSSLTIDSRKGRFRILLKTPVGTPAIEELLQRLLHLENLLACVAMVLQHPRLSIRSLSLSQLSLVYLSDPAVELGCIIRFNSTERKESSLELSPRHMNPHIRIISHLRKILENPNRCLSINLKLMLPLLSFTHPILSFFQKIQRPELLPSDQSSMQSLRPRVNILPRHPTMYGIQYFGPPGSASTMPMDSEGSLRMLARFEILPYQRGKLSLWLLRPAIEEFESYTRQSFSPVGIQQKLHEEVFTKKDPEGGWLPLATGAACHVDKPERLLQAVHDLISTWIRDNSIVETGAQPDEVKAKSTTKAQPQNGVPVKAAPAQKPTTNGTNTLKAKPGPQAPKKNAQAQLGRDVITID